MANVYLNIYKRIADGDTDLGGGSTVRMEAFTTEAVIDEDLVTLADFVATPHTRSATGIATVTGPVAVTVTGVTQYKADKGTFPAVSAGETFKSVVLFHEVSATDANRFLIAYFDIPDTVTNGGDIEIRWNSTDGLGIYLTTVNV